MESQWSKKSKNKNDEGNVKSENDNNSNLTESEINGMRSLKARVKSGEIVITETDKSKRFSILTKEQYRKSGLKHTSKDQEISVDKLSSIQNTVNSHCSWVSKIFGIGSNWEHTDRVASSMTENSESVAPLYLLIKDQKGWTEDSNAPPPSRPVCSGNRGFNKHLSELVSLILEPLSHSTNGAEVNSTGSFLDKIQTLNNKRKNDELQTTEVSNNSSSQNQSRGQCKGQKVKCSGPSQNEIFMKNFKKERFKKLRNMVNISTNVPNFKSKIWASRLNDEVEGKLAINLPKSCESCEPRMISNEQQAPLQMNRKDGWSIVGTDVEALFPSLADIESAKIVREAVRESSMRFNNVDFERGLIYLRIVGGADYLKETVLRNRVPIWKGKRPDLVSVGGELRSNLQNS